MSRADPLHQDPADALRRSLTIIALVVLGWYYLRLPAWPASGSTSCTRTCRARAGLYSTANVTYRGIHDRQGHRRRAHRARRPGDDEHRQHIKIPVDATANVHSVSAIGEQYLDLVSTGDAGQVLPAPGQTITKSTVPSEVGPALDAANSGLAVLPKEKIDALLDETAQAVGGLGPALQRLVDSTTAIASDFKDNLGPVNDIINNSAPILDSQVQLRRRDRAVGGQPEHHRRRRPRSRTRRCAAGCSRPPRRPIS